jgi:hypothetical protein
MRNGIAPRGARPLFEVTRGKVVAIGAAAALALALVGGAPIGATPDSLAACVMEGAGPGLRLRHGHAAEFASGTAAVVGAAVGAYFGGVPAAVAGAALGRAGERIADDRCLRFEVRYWPRAGGAVRWYPCRGACQ